MDALRGAVDHRLHAVLLADLEQGAHRVDVGLVVDVVGDVDEAEGRGEVVDGVAALDSLAEVLGLGDVADDDFGAEVRELLEKLLLLRVGGAVVVEDDALVALSEDMLDKVAAGEAGSAGD